MVYDKPLNFTHLYILSALILFVSVLAPIVGFDNLVSPEHAVTLGIGWIFIGLTETLAGLWFLFRGMRV